MLDMKKLLGNITRQGVMKVLTDQLGGATSGDLWELARAISVDMTEVLCLPDTPDRDALQEELVGQLGTLTEIKRLRVSNAVLGAIKTGIGIVFSAALGAVI